MVFDLGDDVKTCSNTVWNVGMFFLRIWVEILVLLGRFLEVFLRCFGGVVGGAEARS